MDPPSEPSSPNLQVFWAAWLASTVGGPLLAIGSMLMMSLIKLDLDIIWTGILWLTLAGIIWSSTKIAVACRRHRTAVGIGLSLGGVFLSFAIFFGACLASIR